VAAPPHRLRLKVLLGAAFAALLGWWLIPGSAPDRAAFSLVARAVANPPFFIGGFGTRQTPWSLRTFSAATATDKRHAPLIVALGDDPQGVFQTSPPSPVDMAVVFSNFQRLGAKKAASAAVLAWDAPDVIGLTALETTLGKFDSLVMAAPVTRGASPQPLPPVFRRTSVPVSAVIGDASMIPVVNRIPLPGVILGGTNASAGFQTIDSEQADDPPFLLARWDDRVVFAFPLVVVLQRLEIPVDAVEIRPGSYLRLGKSGPTVPIDRHGRMTAPLSRTKPYARIVAEDLIDGGDGLFPRQAPDPVILRDDRGSAEPSTSRFSANVAGVIAAIASDSGMAEAVSYPRPALTREWLLLAAVCALAAMIAGLAPMASRICYGLLGTAVVIAQFIGFGMAEAWLPGLAAWLAIATAWGFHHLLTILQNAKTDLTFSFEGMDGSPQPSGECVENESTHETIHDPPMVEHSPPIPADRPEVGPCPDESVSPDLTEPVPSPAEPPKKKPRAPRRKAEPKPAAEIPSEAPKPKRTRKTATPEPAAEATPKPARKSAARKSARRKTGDAPPDP
jgi:hypothetical protein